jgi:hypothetical protein
LTATTHVFATTLATEDDGNRFCQWLAEQPEDERRTWTAAAEEFAADHPEDDRVRHWLARLDG